MRRILTYIGRMVVSDDFSQFQVPRNDCYLVRALMSEVEGLSLGTPEQEYPGTRFGPVDSTHVKGGVTGCVTSVGIRSVEQEVLEMLRQTVAACLEKQE